MTDVDGNKQQNYTLHIAYALDAKASTVYPGEYTPSSKVSHDDESPAMTLDEALRHELDQSNMWESIQYLLETDSATIQAVIEVKDEAGNVVRTATSSDEEYRYNDE